MRTARIHIQHSGLTNVAQLYQLWTQFDRLTYPFLKEVMSTKK